MLPVEWLSRRIWCLCGSHMFDSVHKKRMNRPNSKIKKTKLIVKSGRDLEHFSEGLSVRNLTSVAGVSHGTMQTVL